ncbi:MAG: RsmD family RNA methyltransferase [Pseudomonadota bacterium]
MSWTIARLGHRGDGLAEGPIYAPRTLPGEVVTGALDGDRLQEIRVLTPSDHRVSAPCRHYRGCGGCALQHADDGFVADWKQGVVAAALAAQGLDAPFKPIAVSPPGSRRRATFSGRRTKKGALVGFHGAQSAAILPVPDCLLVTPALQAALPMLEALTCIGGSRKGEVSFAVTETRTGLDIAVTGGKPVDAALGEALTSAIRGYGVARLSWDGELVAQEDPPVIAFDGLDVPLPPGAFLQATLPGEAALRSAVEATIGAANSVVDLFAGCGTFALPLSRRRSVLAVEGDTAMLSALEAGWRAAGGLHALETAKRDLFRNPLLADELDRFDAIVIDPPRAGAEAQMAQIAQCHVPVVAAVSCNPVTFARDAKCLTQAGYRLEWVQVVDQFRWSPHVELAACLTRSHIAT